MDGFTIEIKHPAEGAALVTLAGPLDVYTAPETRTALVDLTNQGRHRVALDLADVGFIDSTGLGVLVGHLKRCRAHGGNLALICPSEGVRRALRVTGVGKVMAIRESAEDALACLTPAEEPDDFPEIVRLDSLEWGHRFTHDGTAGPDASREDALALAARFRPGYVEIVHRIPGRDWERAEQQPHDTATLIASLERARGWWRDLANLRGQFVPRLRDDDLNEWRKAERALEGHPDEPRSRFWALFSPEGRALDVSEFDAPRTRTQAREALARAWDLPGGLLEPIEEAEAKRLRESCGQETRRA